MAPRHSPSRLHSPQTNLNLPASAASRQIYNAFDAIMEGSRRVGTSAFRDSLQPAAQDDLIDLTLESSPLQPQPSEGQAASRRSPGRRAAKRRRVDGGPDRESRSRTSPLAEFQQSHHFLDLTRSNTGIPVDLTAGDEEAEDAGLRRIQEAQRQRHQKLQEQQNQLLKESVEAQRQHDNGPVRLNEMQCVICMENMTDLTATICGHIFCHTCIMEALIAGERQSQAEESNKIGSRCPVCRAKVVRNPKANASQQVIPLEIKFVSRGDMVRKKEGQDEDEK